MIITFVISVVSAVEHREISNILFVGRFAADEDPEGFPLTYPAWHRNSITKKTNQQITRGSNGLKLTTCVKHTRHNDSIKDVRRIRSPPILEGTLTHQDVTHFERAQAYPEYMVEKKKKVQDVREGKVWNGKQFNDEYRAFIFQHRVKRPSS